MLKARGLHLSIAGRELVRALELSLAPGECWALLGRNGAGKTSLMASFFLQLANGQHGAFAYRFASSRTLYGFQDLVDRVRV